MSGKLTRLFIIISFVILIVTVLFLTAWLNISSLTKSYVESTLSGYSIGAAQTVSKIEYAVKYGKRLDNFYGISTIISELSSNIDGIDEIKIFSKNGNVIYSHKGEERADLTKNEIITIKTIKTDGNSLIYIKKLNNYILYLPIVNRRTLEIDGVLSIYISGNIFEDLIKPASRNSLRLLAVISPIAVILLIILLSVIPLFNEDKSISKVRLITVLLSIVSLTQISYGIGGYFLFKDTYSDITKKSSFIVLEFVKQDINSVIKKGITINELGNINSWLNDIKGRNSIVDALALKDSNNRIIASCDGCESISDYTYTVNIDEDIDGNTGTLNVAASQSYINARNLDFILDIITMLITALLFMIEIAIFIIYIFDIKPNKSSNLKNEDQNIIRPLSFVFFFAHAMVLTFIPLRMKEFFSVDTAFMSEGVFLAMPITVEMLLAGVFIVLAGYLADKYGWKIILLSGIAVFSAASILGGLSETAVHFVISRGLTGIGYGMAYMGMLSYATTNENGDKISEGLAAFHSGIYAGINCGVIIGAMLADRMGFSKVFYFMFAVSAFSGFSFLVLVLKSKVGKTLREDNADFSPVKSLLSFLTDRKVVTLFIFITIPAAVIIMFIDYFFPIFSGSLGVSSSNVGRAFLLNGLCIVYLGPTLSKFFEKSVKIKSSILFSGLLIAISLIQFAYFYNMLAAFVTVVLLGIAESFGLVAQEKYLIQQDVSKRIGAGASLGYYGIFRKTGQSLGPLVFGAFLVLRETGILIIGLSCIILAFLFIISSNDYKKRA